jgi:hypothetical protein
MLAGEQRDLMNTRSATYDPCSLCCWLLAIEGGGAARLYLVPAFSARHGGCAIYNHGPQVLLQLRLG